MLPQSSELRVLKVRFCLSHYITVQKTDCLLRVRIYCDYLHKAEVSSPAGAIARLQFIHLIYSLKCGWTCFDNEWLHSGWTHKLEILHNSSYSVSLGFGVHYGHFLISFLPTRSLYSYGTTKVTA